MGGSEERPVSMAKISGVRSSKHSSSESNPDSDPKMANQGVQAWAGTRWFSGEMSLMIWSSVFESRPRMGRPSDRRLPIFSRRAMIFAAVSKEGAYTKLWILRHLPFFL